MIRVKLLNFIFGWDYIQFKDTHRPITARVYSDGEMVFYFFPRYGICEKISDPDDVLWLTCSKEKYFKVE